MQKKKCPFAGKCDSANDKLDDVWKFTCPKDRIPDECLKFETYRRDEDALQSDSRVASNG
jgi:hypothetical protein